jgi:hypothetical protein
LDCAAEFQDRIINKAFMERWFASGNHTFALASLISIFLQDNETGTDHYLAFVSEIKTAAALGAHFGSVCSIADSLTIHRIAKFFDILDAKTWETYEVGTFLREAAGKIQGGSAAGALLSQHERWLKKWLFATDPNIRHGAADMVYALFKSFPRFPLSASFSGYPTWPTQPYAEGVPTEHEQFLPLFSLLVDQADYLVSQSKAGAAILGFNKAPIRGHVPTDTFFGLLDWCVFAGGLQAHVMSKKPVFVSLMAHLAILKNDIKWALCDAVHFLAHYDFTTQFWDARTIGVLLNAVGNFPEKEISDYVAAIGADVFRILRPLTVPYEKEISHSKILKYAIQACLSAANPLRSSICELVLSIARSDDAITAVAKEVLSVFPHHYEHRNDPFLELVLKLLDTENVVGKFTAAKLHILIVTQVDKQLAAPFISEYAVQRDLRLLARYSEQVPVFYKSDFWLTGLHAFVGFWKSHAPLLQNLVEILQRSNTSAAFAEDIIRLLFVVLSCHKDLVVIGLGILQKIDGDFYGRIHNSARVSFARFTIQMLKLDATKANLLPICSRDLLGLEAVEISDPEPYLCYFAALEEVQNFGEIGAVLGRFLSGATSLVAFGIGNIATRVGSREQQSAWDEKCAQLLSEELQAITAEITEEEAGKAERRIKAGQAFLAMTHSQRQIVVDPGNRPVLEGLRQSEKAVVQSLAEAVAAFIP